MSDNKEISAALIGKTGCGKSSLGNLLLGRDAFATGSGVASVTGHAAGSYNIADGEITLDDRKYQLKVTDTIGLGDNKTTWEITQNKISAAITVNAEGVDVIVMVIKVERFTQAEFAIYKIIKEHLFGEDCLKFMLLVVTQEDNLGKDSEGKKKTPEKWLQESRTAGAKPDATPEMKGLAEMITSLQDRIVFVANKEVAEDEPEALRLYYTQLAEQSREKVIRAMIAMKQSGGRYTPAAMRKAQEEFKKREKELKDAEAKQEKARIDRIYKEAFEAGQQRVLAEIGKNTSGPKAQGWLAKLVGGVVRVVESCLLM